MKSTYTGTYTGKTLKDLPPGYTVQKNNLGKFRYVRPNGEPDTTLHDYLEEAIAYAGFYYRASTWKTVE
jgi:hypothetical protein